MSQLCRPPRPRPRVTERTWGVSLGSVLLLRPASLRLGAALPSAISAKASFAGIAETAFLVGSRSGLTHGAPRASQIPTRFQVVFSGDDAIKSPTSRLPVEPDPPPAVAIQWLTAAVAMAGCVVLMADLATAGLGMGSTGIAGGLLPFLNSLNSTTGFRTQRCGATLGRRFSKGVPAGNRAGSKSTSGTAERGQRLWRRSSLRDLHVLHRKNSLRSRAQLIVLNFFAKFGSQTVSSLLLGVTPMILRGPKHMASWLTAFACVQLCPGDVVFRSLKGSPGLLMLVRLGNALYYLRKVVSIATLANAGELSLLCFLVGTIVVVDGNSAVQRVATWALLRGRPSFADIRQAMQGFVRRALPLMVAAALLALCVGSGISYVTMSGVKLGVMAFFMARYDVPDLFLKAWRAAAVGPPSVKST
mmetsp:Transcript_78716/g.218691  ORF Transcript_78716/g.218691 Transcript_78716/m.218691 type:complete len:417 (+) Transcript_78716:84-1334(+)